MTLASRPVLGHVNLMMDSFLANANANDLRAIVRATLATCPPSTTEAFKDAAAKRLQYRASLPLPSEGLFTSSPGGFASPNANLEEVLSTARSLYGIGMGLASLRKLTAVVRATLGLKWEEGGLMSDTLAVVDSDISQAVQSAKEELGNGGEGNKTYDNAVAIKGDLDAALKASQRDTARWGGEFPFEKAAGNVVYWKL
ncbi:hypothetical protein K474DRAFT_584365 [Panus rudis PR-1116 ss-1]|nr:hypothetical protein K474DRAFT_584365 [Panus rudis PR-1116 ss-1]